MYVTIYRERGFCWQHYYGFLEPGKSQGSKSAHTDNTNEPVRPDTPGLLPWSPV